MAIYIEPWVDQHGGIAVYTNELVKALVQLGKGEVHYATIGSKPMISGVEHIHLQKWRTSYFNPLRYAKIFAMNLSRLGIDVLIDPAHYASYGLFSCKRKVTVVHDITPLLFPHFHPAASVLAHRFLLRANLRESNKVVTVSSTSRDDVIEKLSYSEGAVEVIYPGVRRLVSQQREANKPAARPYFLCVGTLEPRKNHHTMIKGFDDAASQNKDIELLIVGGKGWKVNVEELIQASPNRDRIHLKGFVSKEELHSLYQGAIASVYASHYEGFGLPVAESMQLGCPVITSNVGSMKEIAGDAAILVSPMSSNEIGNAMLTLAGDADLRQKKIALGRERVKQFDWAATADKFERLLMTLS